MKKIIYLAIVFAITFLNACKKDNTSKSISSIEDTFYSKYLKISDAKEGSISISSTTRNFKKEIQYDIRAGFNKPNYQDITIDNQLVLSPYILNGVTTNQYRINPNTDNNILSQLFGKKITISFNSKELNLRNANVIYNPQSFNMSGGSRNTSLTWNADNSNNKVYILIAFIPERAINENFANFQSVERYIETDDDGFYQLTESDFSGIPLGGHIDVLVARGNTAVVGGQTNGGGSILTYSTSIISGSYGGGGSSGDGGPSIHVL